MLADTLLEYVVQEEKLWKQRRHRDGRRVIGPVHHAPFAEDLKKAVRFSLDGAATRAAHMVSVSNAASMLTALPMARLPAPLMWIEWPESERIAYRKAFDPSFNQRPGTRNPPRIGVLLSETPEGFDIRVGYGSANERCICYGMGRFNRMRTIVDASFDVFRKDLTANDVLYMGGEAMLRDAFELRRHGGYQVPKSEIEHFVDLVEGGFLSVEHARRISEGNRNDVDGEILFAVALVMLFNSRNALQFSEPDLSKVNKPRLRSGRLPLLSYKETRLVLGRAAQRRQAAAEADIASGQSRIEHWQNGHFKVRKTGVFWWSGHIRGNRQLGSKAARYAVTSDGAPDVGLAS